MPALQVRNSVTVDPLTDEQVVAPSPARAWTACADRRPAAVRGAYGILDDTAGAGTRSAASAPRRKVTQHEPVRDGACDEA